jgi:predicted Zn-dependent protease
MMIMIWILVVIAVCSIIIILINVLLHKEHYYKTEIDEKVNAWENAWENNQQKMDVINGLI